MKNLLFLLISLLFASNLSAQEQTGLVREQNSNKRAIAGVQVIFSDAVPTTSDDNGIFKLSFSGKKEGDLIFYEEIRKSGYEIVNKKELEVLKIGNVGKLAKDIILAKEGTIAEARKKYYDISDATLVANFKKEEERLRNQLKSTQISNEAYQQKYALLIEKHDHQQEILNDLANLFARVNFDDVSDDYKQAFELFEEGKTEEAVKILENVDLIRRAKGRLEERERLAAAEDVITQQKITNEQEIKEDIQGIQLQAQLYVLIFQSDKAEDLYDQLLRLDSTDLEILREAGNFYSKQHRYEKTQKIYSTIITHPKAENWHVANAYGRLGELYTELGLYPNAEDAFQIATEKYRKFHTDEPTVSFYKKNLSIFYSKLARTYFYTGELKKTLTIFKEVLRLNKELYDDDPEDELLKSDLANSYSQLGKMYYTLEDSPKSLEFLWQSIKLGKELCDIFPENLKFKNLLSIYYMQLGDSYNTLGDLKQAAQFFEKSTTLAYELYSSYDENISFKKILAICYSKLAGAYNLLGNHPKFLLFSERFNVLEEELYGSYPENTSFKHGLAVSYSNLGSAYGLQGDFQKALKSFEQSTLLLNELKVSSPEDVEYKVNLGNSYQRLGDTYISLGNLKQAQASFKRMFDLFKEFHEEDLENLSFKNGLALSYKNIGKAHLLLGDLEKSLISLQENFRLTKELFTLYPDNASYKNSLANSCERLGAIHKSLGNLQKELNFLEQYHQLARELYELDLNNIESKNGLALSYYKLGNFYKKQPENKDNARSYLQEAESFWIELVRDAPQYVEFQKNLNATQEILSGLE